MAKFKLGRVVATPGALDLLANNLAAQNVPFVSMLVMFYTRRHAAGDWGNVDQDDAAANDRAVETGGMILSSYRIGDGKLYIITEPDRSLTTLLLPDEY
jgi:heme/copper-type cytochrome/quinol oxidase subunit 3